KPQGISALGHAVAPTPDARNGPRGPRFGTGNGDGVPMPRRDGRCDLPTAQLRELLVAVAAEILRVVTFDHLDRGPAVVRQPLDVAAVRQGHGDERVAGGVELLGSDAGRTEGAVPVLLNEPLDVDRRPVLRREEKRLVGRVERCWHLAQHRQDVWAQRDRPLAVHRLGWVILAVRARDSYMKLPSTEVDDAAAGPEGLARTHPSPELRIDQRKVVPILPTEVVEQLVALRFGEGIRKHRHLTWPLELRKRVARDQSVGIARVAVERPEGPVDDVAGRLELEP